MKENWKKQFEYLLESEGGYQDDPDDAGNHLPDGRAGCTNLGVTQQAWEAYVGHKVSNQDMRDLTAEKIEPFYKRRYWDATLCDSMPSGVDYCLFDLSINAGSNRSAKVMQSAVGVEADGQIGKISLAAIIGLEPKYVIEQFTEEKIAFYKGLNNPKYEQGWLNRAETVRQRALKMIE